MSDDKNHDQDKMMNLYEPTDEFSRIGEAIQQLTYSMQSRYRELQRIMQITAQVSSGLFLDEILEGIYTDFKDFIPYDRIGFSIIDDDNKHVTAYWEKSNYSPTRLQRGYKAELSGSSLETIVKSSQPRIINDLIKYFEEHPDSKSTALILKEGIRSSLTCPLIANGTPIGFMFFSSCKPNMYANVHVDIFQQIATPLSIMVEKSRMVTILAEQKAELQEKNKALKNLNELKNSFLGVAAHDLRGPLANVQMGTALLLSEEYPLEPEEQRNILLEVDKQVNYMFSLLNDLLDISHIESGKFTLTPEQIFLPELLSEVVKHHQRVANPKNITIQLEITQSQYISVDPMRLRQALDNLISNAIKFSPPHTKITVRAQNVQDACLIEIEDQGPGITMADKRRMFKAFSKLSARPTGGEKSTGLGLAITQRIIKAHGGKIGVNSEEGQGATFWFTLPEKKINKNANSNNSS